jgi:hypothetical protein
MKREFYHYTQWEDYKSGMYRNVEKSDILDFVSKAKDLLSSPEQLGAAMAQVVTDWPVSAAHNLTNNEANSKAWLGQAACCIAYNVPEDLTRMAWNTLSTTEMRLANNEAEQVIKRYEQSKKKNGLQKDLFRD